MNTEWWDDFVAAWKSVGLTMEEVSEAVNNWATHIVEEIAGESDAPTAEPLTHGMTLDELIPETIAEWRQLKDDL